MVPQANNAVALAGYHNLGELKDYIVSCCEAAVIGEAVELGVREIPLHDRSKIVDLLGARFMNPYPLRVQQVLPGHPLCRK
jgi:hypothetical protein